MYIYICGPSATRNTIKTKKRCISWQVSICESLQSLCLRRRAAMSGDSSKMDGGTVDATVEGKKITKLH